MTDFDSERMLKVLYDAVLPISSNRYLQERPAIINEKVKDFVVVSCPYTQYKRVYGYDYGSSRSMCRIEMYARDKGGSVASGGGGTIDIKKLGAMEQAALALFPIVANGVRVSSPKPVLKSSDGFGFHAVVLNCNISLEL
jgi:hypothetical protein